MFTSKLSKTCSRSLVFFALTACGSDGGPSKVVDGGSGGGANAPADGGGSGATSDGSSNPSGEDAGSGGPGGSGGDASIKPEAPCADGQPRCRGACFDTIGQIKNACEWVAKDSAKLSLENAAAAPGALFATTYKDGNRSLVRIDTKDFSVKVLADGIPYVIVVGVHDNWLYYYNNYRVSRVSVDGGRPMNVLTLNDDYVAQALIHGDHVYASSNGSMWRAPLAGGSQEEVVTEGIRSMAQDAEYLYTSYIFRGVERRSWTALANAEVLHSDPGHTDVNVLTLEGRPREVFWQDTEGMSDVLLSVPSNGGALKKVYGLESTHVGGAGVIISTGLSFVYFFRTAATAGAGAKEGIDRLSPDGSQRATLDPELGECERSVAEDAAYFYLTCDGSLFRLAKANL